MDVCNVTNSMVNVQGNFLGIRINLATVTQFTDMTGFVTTMSNRLTKLYM